MASGLGEEPREGSRELRLSHPSAVGDAAPGNRGLRASRHLPPASGELRNLGPASVAALALVVLTSAILVATLHNKFWWAPDEGNYAHVAERLLSGETLHKDIQDVHAGYIHFVNSAAFSLFGVRLVSLRYPLAALAVVQSVMMFLLLRPRGLLPAAIGAIALTSLGFVQFLDPTANWYCLFLAIATVCWLRWAPVGKRETHFLTGILIGTTFLFRQLSGVLLGMGVLVFLLLAWPRSAAGKRPILASALLAVIAAGLAAYLLRATDAVGWLLLGIWPFPILFHAWRRTAVPNREILGTMLAMALGAAVAALPLITYHVAHGSMGAWFSDTVGAAVSLPALDFIKTPGYVIITVLALRGLGSGEPTAILNGAFWLSLLLIPAVLGMSLLRALLRGSTTESVHPLPIVALFYGLVSVHYQSPIYLFYTVGLSLAAILWLATGRGQASRTVALCSTAIIAVVAVHYHAAMPLSRGFAATIAGERRSTATPLPFSRAGIYVDAEDAARYRRYVDLIEQETEPGDSIFAVPTNAELYFLARRSNPFRFYNTALGIRSSADLDSVLHVLKCHPPKLVFYDSTDKYNTAASARIGRFVRNTYEPLTPLPPFEIFRRSDRNSGNGGFQGSCNDAGR